MTFAPRGVVVFLMPCCIFGLHWREVWPDPDDPLLKLLTASDQGGGCGGGGGWGGGGGGGGGGEVE